jgi:hypothetical protein
LRKNFLFSSKAINVAPSASNNYPSLTTSSSFASSLNQIEAKSAVSSSNDESTISYTQCLNSNNVNVFCECGGLANLLNIILYRKCPIEETQKLEFHKLIELCVDLLHELVKISSRSTNEITDFIMEQDRYIKAFWMLIERCVRSYDNCMRVFLEKIININKILFVEYIECNNYKLNNNMINFVYDTIKE